MASPLLLLKEANKAYPASNLVWIAIALAAGVAIISAFELGFDTLLSGGVVILIAILVFATVAMFHKALVSVEEIPGVKFLAAFLAWTFTFLIIGFFLGMFSAFFFEVPKSLRELFDLPAVVRPDEMVAPTQGAAVLIQPAPAATQSIEFTAAQTADPAVVDCLGAIDTSLAPDTVLARSVECLQSVEGAQ